MAEWNDMYNLFRSLVLAAMAITAIDCAPVLAAPPNIVIILSDDQAWNDYHFLGHPQIQTPHIDRLARESLTFTRGYVPDSLCRPSLTTLITGRYPHQHGIVGNDPPPPAGLENAPKGKIRKDPRYQQQIAKFIAHIDDEQTLPKILHDRLGYLSFQTGKWWEGHYTRGGFTHGMSSGDPSKGGRHGDEGLAIGRQGMQPIYDFISQAEKDKKPFFVWYAPMMPHSPHTPPQRILDKYRDKTPHLEIAKYWAMCEWFDETVGELMSYLDTHALASNTIVVYLSDNGWINDENADRYAPRSKRSQYDGGLRTPIMIRWPGHVAPKMDVTHLASEIDIVPTLLAAVGISVPPALPGINLLDAMAVDARQKIFGEVFEHDVQHLDRPADSLMYRWVISGDWKLILPNPIRVPDGSVELYQLRSDPGEQHNVAGDNPETVLRLTRDLNQWWDGT
jgi:uncharacterized sulfatase